MLLSFFQVENNSQEARRSCKLDGNAEILVSVFITWSC